MATIGTLQATIGADTRGLRTSLNRAERDFKGFAGGVNKGLATMRKHWLAIGATVATVTLGMKKTLNEFESFETALVDMGKVTDRSLPLIRKEIMALPAVLGSATDMMKGYYQVISAGVTDPVKAIELLVEAARAANAAHVNQAEVIKGLTKVMKGYGGEIEKVSTAADLLFMIEKKGQTTVGELIPVIGGLAKMSHEAGVSIDEMGGALALISLTARDTAEAATQYEMLMMALIKPMGAMKTAMKDLHYESGITMVKELGLSKALKTLTDYMRENNIAMGDLFESKRGLLAMLSLMDKEYSTFNKNIEEMADKAGMADKAFQKWKRTFAATGQVFKNTIGKLLIEFGNTVAPAVQSAMINIADAIESAKDNIIFYVNEVKATFSTMWTIISAVPVGMIDFFNELQKELEETEEKAKSLSKSFTPLDRTTWQAFVDYLDVWGRNTIRVFAFMGKEVGTIMGLMIGDVIEMFKLLARELWAVAGMIEGVLTLDISKVKKSWDEVGTVWNDYTTRTSANWKSFTKTTEKNWSGMIKGMRSEFDKVELIEPIIKKVKAAQKPIEDAGKNLGKTFSVAFTDEMQKELDKAIEDIRKFVETKQALEEDVTDRIYKLTHSETANLIYELDKRREALGRFKIEEAKINEWYALELEKIHEDANEKIKDQTESIWDDMADIFKTTFTDAVTNELKSLEDVWDMLWNRMKYKMVDNLGDMVAEWIKGIGEMQTDAQMTVDMVHKAGIEGPGMASGKFFAGSTQLFDRAVDRFGGAVSAVSMAMPQIAAVYAIGKTIASFVPESTGWQGEAGPKGYMKGMGEMGPVGATLGLFGLHPMGAGEERHMERVLKRVQEFYDEYNDIMEKEYSNLVDMVSDFNHLISSQHIEALEEMGHVSESQVGSLHALAEALGIMKNEAETAFAVSVGSMRRMETSAKQLALIIPEAADKIGAMTDKMKALFMEDFMEKFERGLMDVDEAVKQLVRSGMSQLDAQTILLGEDYNELIVMLGGSIEPIDKVSESFNEMYESLDELDTLIADLPDSFGKVKQSLQELSYGLRYLLNMTQSLINTMDDLTKLPEILESMGKAIEEGDWDQAAKDLYKLQNIALEASSAFAQLGEALDYLKMAELGAMFTGLGQAFAVLSGILAVIRMIAEFFGVWDDLIVDIQIAFLEFNKAVLILLQDLSFGFLDFSERIAEIDQQIVDLQKEAELVADIFTLWQEEIDKMSRGDLISDIADGLREWQDIIDRFEMGDIKADMKDLLEDVWYAKAEIARALEAGWITGGQAEKATSDLEAAMRIQINAYFDTLLDSFDDFKDRLKRDMQALTKEERMGKDVTEDMRKLWREAGEFIFTPEMDPAEFLANAEEMRGLILERYAIEKAELEETKRLIEEKYNAEIAIQEGIKSAWMSVLDDVTAKLDSLKTSGMNQADIFERMGEQMSIVQRLEAEAMGETDLAKRAGIETQIASAYMDYLTMAEKAHTRPSLQYKEIYDMVVGKLEALQLEAQETISAADREIIRLNDAMNEELAQIEYCLEKLRLDTIAELQWLSGQTGAAKGVLEGMRDDALAAIKLDIGSLEEYLTGDFKTDISDIESDMGYVKWYAESTNIKLNSVISKLSDIKTAIGGITLSAEIPTVSYASEWSLALGYLEDIEWNTRGYGWFPRHEQGIDYVPRTGLALIHQGEKIIPAGENEGGSFSIGDIYVTAGSGADGGEIADTVIERIEHEMRWGRINKIMKEETRNVA